MAGTQHQIHTLQSALRGIQLHIAQTFSSYPELWTLARMQDQLPGKGLFVALNWDIKRNS